MERRTVIASVACVALTILAAAAGWWMAHTLDGRRSAPATESAVVPVDDPVDPVAAPEEALPPPRPAPPPVPADPDPAPVPGPAAGPAGEPDAPATDTAPAAPDPAPTPRPRRPPAIRDAPAAPDPEPQPDPPPAPRRDDPRPIPEPAATTPAVPTTPTTPTLPEVVRTSSPPPATRAISRADAFTGSGAARAALLAARARAATGSGTAAAIDRQLELWRRYLGPDSGSVPAGRRATVARALHANAWWYSRWRSPPQQVLLRDPDGVILTYRVRQGFAVNPVATTGRWRDLNAEIPVEELAGVMLPMGVSITAAGRPMLVWEYYDVVGDPTAIGPGISGMAQARIALVMANAHRITGDERFAAAAERALLALTVDVDLGGARSMVSMRPGEAPSPWYVERAHPGDNPWKGAALNGFMVTLLNLRGAAAALSRPPEALEQAPVPPPVATRAAERARRLADDGVETLARHLPDHDTGTWTYYGMLSGGRPWRTYLADLNYHCYHIHLLGRLAAVYPDHDLTAVADRWSGYVSAADLTCRDRG